LRWFPAWVFPMLPGVVLYLVAFVPSVILLVALSFHTYVPGQGAAPLFTLENYVRFLTNSYYQGLLFTTFYLSAVASIVAVVIGYPIAYVVVRSARLRRILLPVLALSFFVSAIVRLYGWLGILGRGGPLNAALMQLGLISEPIPFLYGTGAVVIGLADFAIPYAALILVSSINNLDESLEEASQNLGATRWQTLVRVTLPLTFPALLAALILSFVLSTSAVLVPTVLGGGRVPMLGTLVYSSMLESFNYPFASASLIIMLLAIFGLTFAAGRALKTRVIR
jgi:ABC-type spermidine/putrescine transport system permease subunit I